MSRLDYTLLTGTAAQAMFDLEKVVSTLDVDPTIKQLIRMRVSQINGCLFCLDMHAKEARLHGERELRLHHLAAWEESPLFTDKERAALHWAEAMTRLSTQGVSDEDYSHALQYFSEKQLSDLSFVVMTINAWNRLGVSFKTKPGLYDKMLGLDKAGLE